MVISISILFNEEKGNGRIIALNHNTRNILKIFDPTTLPIAISASFL